MIVRGEEGEGWDRGVLIPKAFVREKVYLSFTISIE